MPGPLYRGDFRIKLQMKNVLNNFANMLKRNKSCHNYSLCCRIAALPLMTLFLAHVAAAQQGGSCDSAIEINYANVQHIQAHAKGKAVALLSMPHAKGMYFEKPHSLVWFTFVVPKDTLLTFDLIPDNNSDDLDFLLFRDQNATLCSSIGQNKRPVPVRSNIADNAFTSSGRTGLAASAAHDMEAPGKHPAFSRALEVKKGERYYLAVDDYTSAFGTFSLHLNLYFPQPGKPAVQAPPPPPVHNIVPLPSPPVLKIIVADSGNKPVKARIKLMSVAGSRTRTIADTTGTSEYQRTVMAREHLKVICISQGYLLYQSEITIPDTATLIRDTVRLSVLREHRSIVLQDIEFEPELEVFLPTAAEPLSDLLAFMQSNPTIHILIKGYVNDPFTQNSGNYDMDLSERRAKAVMKYLTEHHIDKSRMDWKGFGNKDMLYPKPQTMEEQRANRRVEIEIEP